MNEAPDETWRAIDSSLRRGSRDLKGSISLAGLLARQRGLRNRRALRDFTIEQILEWADAHYTATGRWPSQHSGAVAGSPGETWSAVDTALAQGHRGLAGGSSLAKILDRYLRKPERRPK